MGQIGMAARLALRPVADVVLADHAVGSRHADQRAEIDEQPLEPERAVVGRWMSRRCMPSEWPRQTVTAVVDNEQRQRAPGEEERPADQRSASWPDPERLDGLPAHLPSTALVSSASNMRGERKVLAERCSASSTGSSAPVALRQSQLEAMAYSSAQASRRLLPLTL